MQGIGSVFGVTPILKETRDNDPAYRFRPPGYVYFFDAVELAGWEMYPDEWTGEERVPSNEAVAEYQKSLLTIGAKESPDHLIPRSSAECLLWPQIPEGGFETKSALNEAVPFSLEVEKVVARRAVVEEACRDLLYSQQAKAYFVSRQSGTVEELPYGIWSHDAGKLAFDSLHPGSITTFGDTGGATLPIFNDLFGNRAPLQVILLAEEGDFARSISRQNVLLPESRQLGSDKSPSANEIHSNEPQQGTRGYNLWLGLQNLETKVRAKYPNFPKGAPSDKRELGREFERDSGYSQETLRKIFAEDYPAADNLIRDHGVHPWWIDGFKDDPSD